MKRGTGQLTFVAKATAGKFAFHFDEANKQMRCSNPNCSMMLLTKMPSDGRTPMRVKAVVSPYCPAETEASFWMLPLSLVLCWYDRLRFSGRYSAAAQIE